MPVSPLLQGRLEERTTNTKGDYRVHHSCHHNSDFSLFRGGNGLKWWLLRIPVRRAAIRKCGLPFCVRHDIDGSADLWYHRGVAAELWGITDRELKEIRRSLEELS